MAGKSDQSAEIAALKKQCNDCCKELISLKKEIANLKVAVKKQASSSSKSGKDPRVDKIVEYVKLMNGRKNPDTFKKINDLLNKL